MMGITERRVARRRRLVRESGFFNEEYYLQQGPDCGLHNPLDHYMEQGWRDGFDPSVKFSTLFYLSAYPDVEAAAANPLLHYVEHGRSEGRIPLPDDYEPAREGETPNPVAPTLADWLRVEERSICLSSTTVDIIVPVYRGFSETLRCLFSVLSARQLICFRVIVVYDHGPNSTLKNALMRLMKLGLIEFLETPRNLGFVHSCNIGLGYDTSHDVVLLNSDTEVFGDWLDRLRRAAYSAKNIATVTPFSNNAEICSYPEFLKNHYANLELADADLDALMARTNPGLTVEIPTGVGFCLYIRREALNAIGSLSETHFGRGYGEENDLCRRAVDAGWTNLLAGDVFVRHYGGRSFGPDKAHLVSIAVKKVEDLHPGYNAIIQHFLANDPVRPLREAIDWARVKRRFAERAGFLFVAHVRGGGTERHLSELAQRLEDEGTPVLICRPADPDGHQVWISDPRTPYLCNLSYFTMKSGPTRFAATLQDLGIVHMHIHQIVDFNGPVLDFFRKSCDLIGIKYDITLHDYAYICPRITLVGRHGYYCGEPHLEVCEKCVQLDPAIKRESQGVWEWRERSFQFLAGARKVFAPSLDTARRYARYLPEQEFTIRPHFGKSIDLRGPRESRFSAHENRVIVVIGAIGVDKGSDLILKCAALALERHPSVRFHIVGHTDRDHELRSLGNVTITGRYKEADLGQTLIHLNACVAWFPAVWPETFSYTLSETFAAGIMPIAFDFGAIGERIRDAGWGVLLPPSMMLEPESLLEELVNIDIASPPSIISNGHSYLSIKREYYKVEIVSSNDE